MTPHDFDPANPYKTVIRGSEVLRRVDDLAASGRNVLLAVDSCFSGMLADQAKKMGLVAGNREKMPVRGGVMLMVASQPTSRVGRFANWVGFSRWLLPRSFKARPTRMATAL